VYSVTGYPSGVPQVGSLLATHTQTFKIPYRPSANNKVCTGPTTKSATTVWPTSSRST
jgi:hypothetical protein